MKTLFSWAFFALFALSTVAQTPTIVKSIPFSPSLKTLKADLQYGDIHVNVADVNEIKIEAFVDINDGEWNDSYEFKVKENADHVFITGSLDMEIFKNTNVHSKDKKWGNWNQNKEDDRKVTIAGKSYSYEKKSYEERRSINVDIMIAVSVPRSIVLEIKTLYGSSFVENVVSDVKITATYGSIDAKCNSNLSAKNIDLNSTYSTVDLAIPASLGADIKLKSGYGKIYTDLDFEVTYNSNRKECWFGDEVAAKLNGGGMDVDLNSGYSNLYLRKL